MNTYLDMTCTRDLDATQVENHYYPYTWIFEPFTLKQTISGDTRDFTIWRNTCPQEPIAYLFASDVYTGQWELLHTDPAVEITLWPNKLQAMSWLLSQVA